MKSVLIDICHTPQYNFYKALILRLVAHGCCMYVTVPDSILQIADRFPNGVKVVLSLEKKDKRDQYPKEWILLQEPVGDIHSLIYYSCGLMSGSGCSRLPPGAVTLPNGSRRFAMRLTASLWISMSICIRW